MMSLKSEEKTESRRITNMEKHFTEENLLQLEKYYQEDAELNLGGQDLKRIASELRRLWEMEDDLDEFMRRVAAGAVEEKWEPIQNVTS